MQVQSEVTELQTFGAKQTELGDNGRLIGPIIAIRLIGDGSYDDIAIRVETPPAEADLVLVATGSTDPVAAGDEVAYQLRVANLGPDDSTSTILENQLPFVENSATVTGNLSDPQPANNSATVSTTSANPPCANFSVSQAPNFLPDANDSLFNYTMTVSNAGPDAIADDNLSISRFSHKPAYTFEIMAEMGSGLLERYAMLTALVMNDAGEVAFTAAVGNIAGLPAERFGVFYVDGTGVTPIADETTASASLSYPYIPALADTGEHRESSFNTLGWAIFMHRLSSNLSLGSRLSSTCKSVFFFRWAWTNSS